MWGLTEAERDQNSIVKHRKGLETLERVHKGEKLFNRRERIVQFAKSVGPVILQTIREGNEAAQEIKNFRAQERSEPERAPRIFDQDA